MLTRRTFFASLAALAVSPRVAPVAVRRRRWLPKKEHLAKMKMRRVPRRDDGDTILELR
jgi:hypothetical protein